MQKTILVNKALSSRITAVTGNLRKGYAGLNDVLPSIVHQAIGHSGHNAANQLIARLPARMQGSIKTYLEYFAPLVWRDNAFHIKKGHQPNVALADKVIATLPDDWQTWSKSQAEAKPKDKPKAKPRITKALEAVIKASESMDDDEKASALAFQSYQQNILAGTTLDGAIQAAVQQATHTANDLFAASLQQIRQLVEAIAQGNTDNAFIAASAFLSEHDKKATQAAPVLPEVEMPVRAKAKGSKPAPKPQTIAEQATEAALLAKAASDNAMTYAMRKAANA